MMDTPQPGVFHMNVAMLSTLIAAVGVGLAAYLYLGRRSEVELLKWFFDTTWLHRFIGEGWFGGLSDWSIARSARSAGDALGLGWLGE